MHEATFGEASVTAFSFPQQRQTHRCDSRVNLLLVQHARGHGLARQALGGDKLSDLSVSRRVDELDLAPQSNSKTS
jgi:hypothetical protein